MKSCLQSCGTYETCEIMWEEMDNKSACLFFMECHFNRWQTKDISNNTFENARLHTHTHTKKISGTLYSSVSLPPLISRAKARVISFSSECCSACSWLGIYLWLLLLLQPLHNLIRMRHTDFFIVSPCGTLPLLFFLHLTASPISSSCAPSPKFYHALKQASTHSHI